MAWTKETSQFFSMLAYVTGMVIFVASLLLVVVFPQLQIAFAVAIGAVLAGPFFLLGWRLHPQEASAKKDSEQFWPPASEARDLIWGLLGFSVLAVCMLTPCVVVLRVWARLPPGDNWDVVGIRLVFFVAAYCGWSWWLGVCSKTVPQWFRGRLPDEFLNSFSRKKVSDEPATIKEAAIRNQQFVLVAVVSFLFAAGAINLNGLGLQPIARPGRARRLVAVIMWCQAHPNTTRSTAALIGTTASIMFLYRLRQAAEKLNESEGF